MSRLLLVFLLLFGASVACGRSNVEREERFVAAAGQATHFTVHTRGGEVVLYGAPGTSVVSGRLVVFGESFNAERNQMLVNQTVVDTQRQEEQISLLLLFPDLRDGDVLGAHVDLRVPAHVSVSAHTTGAPIWIRDLMVAAAATRNAPIELRGTRGAANIMTSNAEVTATRHHGGMHIVTTNGNITLRGVSGSVTAQTSNAHIDVQVAPPEGGAVRLQTSEGDVHLALPADFQGRLRARAQAGTVVVEGIDFRPDVDEPYTVRGTVGEGTGTVVELDTLRGNIYVRAVDP